MRRQVTRTLKFFLTLTTKYDSSVLASRMISTRGEWGWNEPWQSLLGLSVCKFCEVEPFVASTAIPWILNRRICEGPNGYGSQSKTFTPPNLNNSLLLSILAISTSYHLEQKCTKLKYEVKYHLMANDWLSNLPVSSICNACSNKSKRPPRASVRPCSMILRGWSKLGVQCPTYSITISTRDIYISRKQCLFRGEETACLSILQPLRYQTGRKPVARVYCTTVSSVGAFLRFNP